MGEAAFYVTARDFVVLELPPDALGKTLFIDSLDERRTDSVSPFTALDEIRKALQKAGCPRFRLSCREADWVQRGDSDLEKVSSSKSVKTLWLNPLDEAEILEILGRTLTSGSIAPVLFLQEAKARKLDPLLSNPLFLKLLSDVVDKGAWPESRSATYSAACNLLVREHNRAHQMSRPIRNSINSQRLLSAAGKLAAVMLLSNCTKIIVGAVDTAAADAFHIDDLPADLDVDKETALAVLDTKLFSAVGDARAPVHRTVGEYLAARTIGDLVSNHGLPLRRVLAIMSLEGTQSVDGLRGVHAWLTLFCVKDRETLIANDPLGLVLYGDVKSFSVGQKTKLLFELQRAAEKNPWFRNENWEAHPFGALGTADMESTFKQFLQDASRDMEHEALIVCLLDAIRFGDTFPGLAGIFEEIARDETRAQRVRFCTVAAWLRDGAFEPDSARRLLIDVSSGALKDPDDEVLGELLDCLYPAHLSAKEVLVCCRRPKRPNLIGQFRMFWAVEFNRRLPDKDLALALETLNDILLSPAARDDIDTPTRAYDVTREVAAKVLVRAVELEGETVPAAQLWTWLSLGLDKYGSTGLEASAIQRVSDWLSHRPEMQRRLVLEGLRLMSDSTMSLDIHKVENRLYDARRPADWHLWLLEQASASADEAFVEYCVDRASYAAVNLTERFDISLEAVGSWIDRNGQRWPQAQQWMERNTAWQFDSWQRRQFENKYQTEARRQQERAKRQTDLGERLRALLTGVRDDWLAQQIALAYDRMFSNIDNVKPLQRVAELLVVADDVAKQAIDAVKRLVAAEYLPSLRDIISVGTKEGKSFISSYPALFAARLCFADGVDVNSWNPRVVEALVGFYMMNGSSPIPDWMRAIAEDNPLSLSDLMFTCWEEQLNSSRPPNVDALQFLRDEDAPRGLVESLLPRVLVTIAADPDERILHFVNTVLLTGAERHLRPEAVSGALTHLLSRSGTSDKFQLALRMGVFVNDPQSQIDAIEVETSKRPDGTYLLAKAIEQRGQAAYDALALHPSIAARLIRVLASAPSIRTPSDDESDDSPYSHQSAVLQRIAHLLAASLSPDAEQALRELQQAPELELWRWWLGALYFQRDRKVKNLAYMPPTPLEVLNVLANKAPANSRDMAELLRDHLSHFAQRIHFEETNLLDLFYDRDRKGVLTPKSENSCRDVLLGLLRDPLALRSVQIEKESVAAAERRADMQASIFVQSGRRILPVEIKKDNHKELWYAWRDQLEPRYMRNPSADGVGVFIVLWFGHKTKVGPYRQKPKSAKQMAEMMSALIPAEYAGHIVGLVIDLSRGLSRG
ncbi:NACHT domain-containing protein [Paraburkholderia fynbosensis]|uniref:Uncharacterized protein n=1 Tax=Paraburkholderia fynbosensis TaxID=1200993 RepID=A0A6J5G7H6_9BURK|nr:hypothetical protein [Paraburkholderia fynbosensis]CAB3794500.1 hypothetical protein LMG27177_03642 [Paraburkholderia fynbosensis]